MSSDDKENLPVEIKEQLTTLLSEDQDIKKLLTMSFNLVWV